MLFVTDTHPFLWYLADDGRMWKGARDVFEDAEAGRHVIVVPTIVLAESFYIVEKKGFEIKFQGIIDKIQDSMNFPPFSLDIEVIREMEKLDEVTELHDRIIVATAKMLNAPLITRDKEIKKSGYVQTI